jgi:hypothetical protein
MFNKTTLAILRADLIDHALYDFEVTYLYRTANFYGTLVPCRPKRQQGVNPGVFARGKLPSGNLPQGVRFKRLR